MGLRYLWEGGGVSEIKAAGQIGGDRKGISRAVGLTRIRV